MASTLFQSGRPIRARNTRPAAAQSSKRPSTFFVRAAVAAVSWNRRSRITTSWSRIFKISAIAAASVANERVIVTRGLRRRRSQTRGGGRPPVRRRGMEAVAVFALRQRLSCGAAMVGRSDVANSRRDAPPSRAPQFHRPAGARHRRPVQFPFHQSGHAQTDPHRGRGQPRERRAHYSADLRRLLRNERSEPDKAFKPGETVALTKGAVVKRTDLAEIHPIQPDDRVGAPRAGRPRRRNKSRSTKPPPRFPARRRGR